MEMKILLSTFDVVKWLDENALRRKVAELSCLFALVVLCCPLLCPRSVSHARPTDFVCWFSLTLEVPNFVSRLLDHKGARLRAFFLPINKKCQASRAAYLAKMTADRSLFTELLPDKRKAANGAAVEKGCGKDGNKKDPSCVEVPDEMEVRKSSGWKWKFSSTSARLKKMSFDDEGGKDQGLSTNWFW